MEHSTLLQCKGEQTATGAWCVGAQTAKPELSSEQRAIGRSGAACPLFTQAAHTRCCCLCVDAPSSTPVTQKP